MDRRYRPRWHMTVLMAVLATDRVARESYLAELLTLIVAGSHDDFPRA